MASDPGDDAAALRERVAQLEQTVSEQQQPSESTGQPTASRRGLLKGAAAVAGLGALGVYSSYPARAQAAGQVGTSAEPVDVQAWDLTVQNQLAADLDGGGNALTNIESVDTGDLQGEYAGKVRVFGNGEALDSIDPANTTTPVQDALDLAPFGGAIELPPGSISNDQTIKWPSTVDLRTRGSYHSTSIDMSTVTGTLFDFEGVQSCDFDGFRVLGPGDDAASTTFMDFHGSTLSDKISFRGPISIRNLYGPLIRVRDVSSYQVSFEAPLFANTVDCGDERGAIWIEDTASGVPSWTFSDIWFYPSATTSASNSTLFSVNTTTTLNQRGVINAGGSTGVILDNKYGNVKLGLTNWEPNNQQSTPRAIFKAASGRATVVDGVTVNSATVDSVYELRGCRNFVMGPVSYNGGTVADAVVEVSFDTIGPSYFYGLSSDVDNTTGGTLTGPVSCFGDLTQVT